MIIVVIRDLGDLGNHPIGDRRFPPPVQTTAREEISVGIRLPEVTEHGGRELELAHQ
jgi:hypothetical protein